MFSNENLLIRRSFRQVSAAIATSLGRGEPPRVKVKVSPVEWFVADEPETHTRYFVIQGSDNFDHWKVPHAASPRLLSPHQHAAATPAWHTDERRREHAVPRRQLLRARHGGGRGRGGRRRGPLPACSQRCWRGAVGPGSRRWCGRGPGAERGRRAQVNLTFDPVPFEDAALGVKVHRGVYQTALALLDRFQPLVEEHLATSPFAKISFTVPPPPRPNRSPLPHSPAPQAPHLPTPSAWQHVSSHCASDGSKAWVLAVVTVPCASRFTAS